MNDIPVQSMQLQHSSDVQGINVSSLHKYQINEIARVILSGITLDIDNIGEIIMGDLNSRESFNKGCVYQVSVPSTSYEHTTLLVRLRGKNPAVCRYDLEADLFEEIPKLTFRYGDTFGVFIVSALIEIIDFTTDVSNVEVIGVI